jgi:NADH-quinone oxidoreductase subunit G
VRFTREISQTGELQVMRRGNHAEIDIFPGEPVDNPLAGNVVDLCPVGALLDKDFLHKQRAWFLSKHDSVCTRCSTGCNVSAEENRGTLWRFKPRQNPFVNDYWICDEGRYSYKAANDPNLLQAMYVRKNGELMAVAVAEAAKQVDHGLKEICRAGGLVAGILSPFLTVEEAYLLASYLKGLCPSNVLALGPVPSKGADQTFRPDQTKGRTGDTSFVIPRAFTIHAEKCPNRRGVSAVLEHFEGKVIGYDELLKRVATGEFRGLYAASGAIDPWIEEAESEAVRSKIAFLVVEDTNVTPLAHRADVVLAGATFAEKAGCYVNADGRLQYSEAALPPRDGALPDLDLLAVLLNRPGGGPVDSSTVLAELSGRIPAFNIAKGGKLPVHGVVMGGPISADGRGGSPGFTDTWFLAHGAARGR